MHLLTQYLCQGTGIGNATLNNPGEILVFMEFLTIRIVDIEDHKKFHRNWGPFKKLVDSIMKRTISIVLF